MKINRQELMTALEATRPGLAAKEIVEQSTSFVFKDGRVYSYNDLIAVSHPCPKELSGAVQSTELYKLLARSSDDELDVETTDTEMLVKGKRNRAGIALQTEITLPIDDLSGKRKWIDVPKGFAEAVKFVLFSAGEDMTRPELTAIHVAGRTVESCDNFRLTRYTLAGKGRDPGFDGDILLPASAATELVKYKPTQYAIGKDNQWIHFTNEAGAEFSCRLVAATYPDLSVLVDQKWEHEIEFHADTAAILDRAQVFLLADKISHPSVDIKVSSGRMTLAAKGAGGWFEETVRVVASKAGFSFTINPQALKDMLPLLKDCELSDNGAVLKFEGENFIHCCSTITEE